jgi:hypothetical protein
MHVGALDTNADPTRFNGWTGGTLQIDGAMEVSTYGPLGDTPTIGSGKTLVTDGGIHVLSGAQLSIGGTGFLTSPVTNDGAFNVNFGTAVVPSAGGLTGISGHATVNSGTLITSRVRQQSLTIAGTGLVALTVDHPLATSIVSRMGPLTITDSARLDLSNKRIIIGGGFGNVGSWNGSSYTGITGLIASGRGPAGGTLWDGTTGIITSQSNATGGNFTSIGVATAAQAKNIPPGGPSQIWSGEFVSSNDVLIMYTYGGDANLDGKITVDDYGRIDFNVGLPGASGWFNGDFNYDGKITVDDYGIIDFNVGIQGAPFFTGAAVTATQSVPGLNAVTAVPEPTMVCVYGIGIAAALARRGRRQPR